MKIVYHMVTRVAGGYEARIGWTDGEGAGVECSQAFPSWLEADQAMPALEEIVRAEHAAPPLSAETGVCAQDSIDSGPLKTVGEGR